MRLPKWAKRRLPAWITALVVLFLLIGVGSIAGQNSKATTLQASLDAANKRLASLQGQLSSSEALNGPLTSQVATLQANVAALQGQVDQLDQREADLNSQAQALTDRESAVKSREKAMTVIEQSSFGDGLFKVGSDIKPGTYRSSGTSGCYWARLRSSDTFDIIDNNNANGPQTLVISSGWFQSQDCGEWVRSR